MILIVIVTQKRMSMSNQHFFENIWPRNETFKPSLLFLNSIIIKKNEMKFETLIGWDNWD